MMVGSTAEMQNAQAVFIQTDRWRLESNNLVWSTIHLQSSYSPVTPRLLSSFNEQWQANEVDGGSDSQRADIFQDKAHQPR